MGDHSHHNHHMPQSDSHVGSTMNTVVSTVASAVMGHNASHQTMDHSGHHDMDHGGHDDMDHGGMGEHGMAMFFKADLDVTILFEGWHVTTVGGMIGSVIGVFILAMIYEGLKFYREHLFRKHFSSLQYSAVSVTGTDGQVVKEIHKLAQNEMLSLPHTFQTLLHIIQMILSYFLMLIFMTYNVWLCIGIIAGMGAGYFFFGWKKATVVDVTDHCH